MAKQFLTFANAVTFFRLILFGAFIWSLSIGQREQAIIFFAAAWGLDSIDGWLARHLKQATSFGSQFDKWTDRLILIFGITLLIRYRILPAASAFLLVKDVALLPAVTIHWAKQEPVKGLGLPGKMMTVLQGVGAGWLIAGLPYGLWVTAAVALVGAGVAAVHLRKIST